MIFHQSATMSVPVHALYMPTKPHQVESLSEGKASPLVLGVCSRIAKGWGRPVWEVRALMSLAVLLSCVLPGALCYLVYGNYASYRELKSSLMSRAGLPTFRGARRSLSETRH